MAMCNCDVIAGKISAIKNKKPLCTSYSMTIVLEICKAMDKLCHIPLLEIPPQRQSNDHSSVHATLSPCLQSVPQSGLK